MMLSRKIIRFYVSTQDYDKIKQDARRDGFLNLSNYVRHKLLGRDQSLNNSS